MIKLGNETSLEWTRVVFDQFDNFLLDHADCERKAQALAMSFAGGQFSDKPGLVDAMIGLAGEELNHFHLIFKVLTARGLKLGRYGKDPYINLLLKEVRPEQRHHLLDKLLMFAVVEARGCERFGLLAKEMVNTTSFRELAGLYQELSDSEVGHARMFVRLAEKYFNRSVVHLRLEEFILLEANIIDQLPLRPVLH